MSTQNEIDCHKHTQHLCPTFHILYAAHVYHSQTILQQLSVLIGKTVDLSTLNLMLEHR